MSEDEITDNLDLMVESINLVQERFSKILEAADFVGSTEGVTLLDAISMRLQVIGELVKKFKRLIPFICRVMRKSIGKRLQNSVTLFLTTTNMLIMKSFMTSVRCISQS